MNCKIVVNAYIRNKSQIKQAERLAEELTLLGADCEIIKNVSLAEIKDGRITAINADVCIFLDKDRACAYLLEKKGIALFNKSQAIEICDDKMMTHIVLADYGISMPDTVYAPLCYYKDVTISDELINSVEELGYPLVAKKCYGSLGADVNLIKDRTELFNFEQKNKLEAHFYQQFIGRGGEDIRVIVIGGKYVCSMKRSNKNDFRSNIELGGVGEKFVADNELISLCEKVASIIGLDYCGIDILIDNAGRYFVCEVNSNAFFTEAERVCGVNIAKKYAEHIIVSKNA